MKYLYIILSAMPEGFICSRPNEPRRPTNGILPFDCSVGCLVLLAKKTRGGDALAVEISFGYDPVTAATSWICFLMTAFVLATLAFPSTFVSSMLLISILRVRS
jgi:hypothetical protein